MSKAAGPVREPKLKSVSSDTPLQRLHLWQIQALRDVLWVGAVIVLVWVGYALRAVTVPLLVALLLAYLFEPLVARLSSHPKVRRPFVVAGLLTTLLVTILLVLAVLVPLVVGQTVRLVQDVRLGRYEPVIVELRQFVPENLQNEYDSAVQAIGGLLGMRLDSFEDEIGIANGQQFQDIPADADADGNADANAAASPEFAPPSAPLMTDAEMRELIRQEIAAQLAISQETAGASNQLTGWLQLARRSLEAVVSFLGQVLQIGFLLFLIPFYFFFFSLWYPKVLEFGRSMVPVAHQARTFDLLGKMDRAVAGFVRGQIVIAAIMGVLFAIGWSICGVPYAVVLGLLVGIFCVVPYLGGIGIPLAVGLLWMRQLGLPEAERMSWIWIIAGPVLVFVVVQLIESYILTPTIAGKATNLDPVTILVAVLAGGTVGGIYGMLLAIPTAACAKILVTDVLMPKIKAWLRGEAEDPLPISRE